MNKVYKAGRTHEEQKELITFLEGKQFFSETGREYEMGVKYNKKDRYLDIDFFLDYHFVGCVTNDTQVTLSRDYMIIGDYTDEDYYYFNKPSKITSKKL